VHNILGSKNVVQVQQTYQVSREQNTSNNKAKSSLGQNVTSVQQDEIKNKTVKPTQPPTANKPNKT
jgi:hypothetical protein